MLASRMTWFELRILTDFFEDYLSGRLSSSSPTLLDRTTTSPTFSQIWVGSKDQEKVFMAINRKRRTSPSGTYASYQDQLLIDKQSPPYEHSKLGVPPIRPPFPNSRSRRRQNTQVSPVAYEDPQFGCKCTPVETRGCRLSRQGHGDKETSSTVSQISQIYPCVCQLQPICVPMDFTSPFSGH